MGRSVTEIPRAVRRRLKRLVQKPSEHGRRTHAIVLLWETGNCVARVARGSFEARSSVERWRLLYQKEYGEQGLRPLERGRSEWRANSEVLEALAALMDFSPRERGYLRSCCRSEFSAIEPQRCTGVRGAPRRSFELPAHHPPQSSSPPTHRRILSPLTVEPLGGARLTVDSAAGPHRA